jgi:hypothetical protein
MVFIKHLNRRHDMPGKKQSRNGHAFHPIMRKGGVHEKTGKAKRKAEKLQTSRKAREWLDRSHPKAA